MGKINLVLADTDIKYIQTLSHYIITHCSAQIRVTTFSKADALEQYLEECNEDIDVFLSCRSFIEDLQSKEIKAKMMLLLTDEMMAQADDGIQKIYKFQAGDKLVLQILELYGFTVNWAVTGNGSDKKTCLLGIYSPVGGSGKTSVALALGSKLSDAGSKVLLLSLEGLGSFSAPLYCTGNRAMSHILLSLKESPEMIGVRAEARMTRDPQRGIYYLEPSECFAEIGELGELELNKLAEGLAATGNYDYILIDMETGTDGRTLAAMNLIDYMILISVPELLSGYKVQTFIKHLQILEGDAYQNLLGKTIPIVNKYNGGNLFELTGNIGTNVYSVPFIHNLWTGDDGRYFFDQCGSMGNALAGLVKDLRGELSSGSR